MNTAANKQPLIDKLCKLTVGDKMRIEARERIKKSYKDKKKRKEEIH
jgi:hypothetical protein